MSDRAKKSAARWLAVAWALPVAGCGSMNPSIQTMAPSERRVLDAHGWRARVGEQPALWISVGEQKLRVIQRGGVAAEYRCSTAARGTGQQEDSRRTPLGWHAVAEKIGAGLPSGAVLVDREFTGEVVMVGPERRDLVLTRILWLRGLEPGLNAGAGIDSYDRYIYIHGTPAESRLGTPASSGCIRLSNRDVIELFDRVSIDTLVLITAE